MFRMLVVLVFVGLCVHTAAALDGSGTQEDPYLIQSLADFDEFASDPNYWSGFTRLETDVNLAGRTYTTAVIAQAKRDSDPFPYGTPFTGIFDGNDHKIIGLTINGGANSFLGLLGYIAGGEVKNLGLEGASVSGGNYVGGLVGWNSGSVSNCYSTSDVNGAYSVGGLVGGSDSPVSNCYSTGDVKGVEDVGGLLGVNAYYYCEFDICISRPGNIYNSYSTGDVNGYYYVGGLVGSNLFGSISNCYSTGDVSGTGWDVGGLVGGNGLMIARGRDRIPGYILNSYSTGSVEGTSRVGGLVGDNLCGAIERPFWDVQTSGEPNMCGRQTEDATGCDPNCGKTTAEMKTRSTFTDAGWDFIEIWLINEGATYPVLRQEIRSDLNGDAGVDLKDLAILASHWLEGY